MHVWMIWALWTQDDDYVRLWAGALTVFAALALLAGVVDVARRRAYDDNLRLVTLAALFTLATGVRDVLVVQLNFPGDGDLRWMSVGGAALILTMGWMLVERATAWARTVHRLNETLSQTVSVRENELRAAFEQLQAAERQRPVEAERQRLMHDRHDGLGILTRAAKIGASVRSYDAHPGTGIAFAFAVHARPAEVDTVWLQPSA